jgi:tetratricopeptide (TPR) repeat protein
VKPNLAWILVVALCACGGPTTPHREPPSPSLDGAEGLVAERIRERTRAVVDAPGSADAWGALGESFDVNGFEKPALESYGQAMAIAPDEWRWPYFAGLLARASDPTQAHDWLVRAAELRPDYAPLRFHLAQSHFLAGAFDEAEKQYRRAIELDATCLNARLGLARVAMELGQAEAALAHLEPAVAATPQEGAVHLHMAQAYRQLGRDREASVAERRTFASPNGALPDGMTVLDDPVREEVRRREGLSSSRQLVEARRLMLLGRNDEASAALERALRANPDSVTALVVSARLLAARGDLGTARTRLARAVELAPRTSSWAASRR